MRKNIKQVKSGPVALCGDCRRACKQPEPAILVMCARYYPYVLKIKREKLKQGSLFEASFEKNT